MSNEEIILETPLETPLETTPETTPEIIAETPLETTREVPANFIAQFFRGVMYPFAAFGFLRRNRLWGMAAASIVVNVVLLVGLIWGGYTLLLPHLTGLTTGMEAWAGESAFLGVLVEVLTWALWIVAMPALLMLNFLVLVLVGQAVASPFLDQLSEQVETRVLGLEPLPLTLARTLKGVSVALGDLVWGVVLLVVVNVPLLLLGLVPVLGTVAAGVLSFSFSALLLAHEFMGLPLTRQLVSYRERWSHLWKHKWLGLGMGTSVMAMLAIPGLNLVLLPLAAVGGTLMYCDLRAGGQV